MSAILASISRRLDRIETARRPPKGLFFVAWGRTPDEIEAALEQARAAGAIADRAPVVRCLWPAGAVPPASRWVRDEFHEIDRPEFDALMDEVDRLADDWRAALRAEIGVRGDPMPTPEAIEAAVPPDDGRARKLHDAALFAGVLAVPLDGARPTLGDDRVWRTLRYIESLGARDRIRGRSRIAIETGTPAAAPTRH